MAIEVFKVDVVKNCAIKGVHYFPNTYVDKKDPKYVKDDNYVYGDDCKGVTVDEQDFKYLITRDKAISACSKDVKYDDKAADLKVTDKKK